MLTAVKSKRFSVTGYKRMFVILIIKTLGSGFKYSTFDYCEDSYLLIQVTFKVRLYSAVQHMDGLLIAYITVLHGLYFKL